MIQRRHSTRIFPALYAIYRGSEERRRFTHEGSRWMYAWDLNLPGDVAVILEHDLEVSPAFYLWLRKAHAKYGSEPDVGEGLPLNSPCSACERRHRTCTRAIFACYQVQIYSSTACRDLWGFAPKRETWREFLAWFEAERTAGKKPYVHGLIATPWYKGQERGAVIANTMWTHWFIKFVDERITSS